LRYFHPFIGFALIAAAISCSAAQVKAQVDPVTVKSPVIEIEEHVPAPNTLPIDFIKGHVNSQSSRYILGPGDKIAIRIENLGKYNQTVVIRPDGFATFAPFGELSVSGTNIGSLQAWLTERFKFYLLKPEVTVDIAEMRNALIYITGAVKRPGTYQFLRNLVSNKTADPKNERVELTLSNVLGKAGGLKEKADITNIAVLHASTGQQETFNLKTLLQTGQVNDIWLLPGDSVIVPEMSETMSPQDFQLLSRSNYYSDKFPVMVLGAVSAQGEVQVDPNNNELNAAIGLAGGYVNRTAKRTAVLVQRANGKGGYSRWQVNPGKSQLALMPGDVVLVTNSKLSDIEYGLNLLNKITLPYFNTVNGISITSQLGQN
jgi:polysaccharide biosynthesis/export protein